jgi:hypothetical protein
MTPVQALQKLLGSSVEGEIVEKLQLLLYSRFGLKLSYRIIESTLINQPDLFSQDEGRWKIRTRK